MGQRSTLCTSQMLDLGSDPCNVLHHEHHFFARNASDFTNRNGYPIIQAPGNSMNLCHQLADYQENLMFYGNDHINVPNHQAIQNLGFGATGPNFYNPNMLLAPSGRIFPVHRSDMMAEQLTSSFGQTDNGINMDETSRHRQVFDGVLSCKRKNFAMIPGNNYYNFNGSASSSSTTSFGVPQWGHSYETLQQAVDATNFAIPEFEGISHRTVQSGSIANASIQPELAFLARQNIFLPRSYTMQTFQPSNNAWFPQYGDGSNIGDGSSSRDKKNTVRYLQGACPNSGPLEVPPVNMQAYASSSSGASSAMLFRQPAMSNFHTPVQNMHVRSYRPHANIPVLPQHRITNLHSSSSRTGDVIDVGATFSHFPCGQFPPSSVDQLYWYQQLPRPAQQFNNGNQRFPPAEDATLMDLSALYGTRNAIDQHQDMRLDIDDMSYEELLALEERIGIVKTGLTEEFIARNLKTKVHVPKIATSTSEPSFRLAMENEDCAVCQVEYLENDIIGSLDCAHSYHADCIKQWLLIKNLCPICKTSALISNGEMK